jgi:RNA polymerase sigma factor (sigma-70 family)
LSEYGTDNLLVNGCLQNNRRAQEFLYKKFHGPMASVCIRYTRNHEDALEVLQTGFMKVFKNIERFNSSKASLYTWVRTIMVNTAIDFLRQKDNWQQIDEATENEFTGIESDAVDRLSAQELLKLVQKLPPSTQAVFNLYVVEGYMHKEIGLMLKISEGTSKWHLSEARRLLQKMLYSLTNAKAV